MMRLIERVFITLKRSERNVAILGCFVLACCFLIFSGVLYHKMYQYYAHGIQVPATIFNVEEVKKYDHEKQHWHTFLGASAQYREGSRQCFVNLVRIPADQAGYDQMREGATRTVTYLPQAPCSGKLNPYAWASLAHGFTIFSAVVLLLLAFVIRRDMH